MGEEEEEKVVVMVVESLVIEFEVLVEVIDREVEVVVEG
jgi:hypothetical protein